MTDRGAPTSKWPSVNESLEDVDTRSRPQLEDAVLCVRRPGLPEVRVEITDGLVIGRSPALADVVLDDDLVSRRHAQLRVDARGYYRLEDLGSRNGLRFHERTVRRLNLVDGDVFYIGQTEMAFTAQMKRLPAHPEPQLGPIDPLMVDGSVEVPKPQPVVHDGLDGIEQLEWSKPKGIDPDGSDSEASES